MTVKFKKTISLFMVVIIIITLLSGCYSNAGKEADENKIDFLIGVSLANMTEPWMVVLTNEIKQEAEKNSNIRIIFEDAAFSSEKQKKDLERLMQYGIDLLIVSSNNDSELSNDIKEIYKQIPVIKVDRSEPQEDYTLYIGPDNYLIGRQAGKEAVQMLGGSDGKILEVKNSDQSASSSDRSRGFLSEIYKHENISVVNTVLAYNSSDTAEINIKNILEKVKLGQEQKPDIIFAHNDYMALGASRAIKEFDFGDIRIIGIDGFPGENGGIKMIKDGNLNVTFTCPTGGREAVSFALDLLMKKKVTPKKILLKNYKIDKENVREYEKELFKKMSGNKIENLKIGVSVFNDKTEAANIFIRNISNVMAEIDPKSIIITAEELQKQIDDINSLINDKVDLLIVSPSNDKGFDEIMKKCNQEGISVIILDNMDFSSYEYNNVCNIGFDYNEMGKKIAEHLISDNKNNEENYKVFEFKVDDRYNYNEKSMGFNNKLKENNIYKIDQYFTDDDINSAKVAIGQALSNEKPDAIYCHTYNIALGAGLAVREKGLNNSIKIVCVELKDYLTQENWDDNRVSYIVSTDVKIGDLLKQMIDDYINGYDLPLRVIGKEVTADFTDVNDLISEKDENND